MFIDVTRFGTERPLRLAIAAVGYIDAVEGGAVIRLLGGESLRVTQSPEQLEARIDAMLGFAVLFEELPAVPGQISATTAEGAIPERVTSPRKRQPAGRAK